MSDRASIRAEQFSSALQQVETVERLKTDSRILIGSLAVEASLMNTNAIYVSEDDAALDMAPFSEFEFEPEPARLQGATDSFHGVIFGNLHTYLDTIPVAVKPFDSAHKTAVHEHTAYNFMERMGFEALQTLGIVACSGKFFLLTRREPSLVTFDNMRWSPKAIREGEMGHEQVVLLSEAAEDLGRMHSMGITHGDAQPKNVALSARGKVGFIDLESLRYNPHEIDKQRITDDLLSFYGKLSNAYGYCRDEDAKVRYSQFYEHFLAHYFSAYDKHNFFANEKEKSKFLTGIKVNLMKFIVTQNK